MSAQGASALDLSQPRGFGPLVGTSFTLLFRQLVPLTAVALAVLAPAYIAAVALGSPAVVVLASPLAAALAALGITSLVLDLAGNRRARVAAALRSVVRRSVSLLGAILLVAGFFLAGIVPFIVPGLYFLVRSCLTGQAIAAESLGPLDAVRRSNELMDGHGWRVLASAAAIALLALVVIAATLLLTALANGAFVPGDAHWLFVPSMLLSQAVGIAFGGVAATLLFFDLRARREVVRPQPA